MCVECGNGYEKDDVGICKGEYVLCYEDHVIVM